MRRDDIRHVVGMMVMLVAFTYGIMFSPVYWYAPAAIPVGWVAAWWIMRRSWRNRPGRGA